MKYLYSIVFCLLLTNSWAQPANDDCSGVIDLGIAPVCTETVYTNINATPTDIGNDNEPSCFISNPPANDVWFQFTTDAVIIDYTITITSLATGTNMDGIDNIQFSIYRGFCGENSLFLNNCATGSVGEQAVEVDLLNLTPNEIYYIRVDNYGDNVAEGDFTVCVEEKEDVTIDEEFSNACSGTLYDSGGPDGNYGDNENFVFTICPSEFHQCVELNMQYFNIESGGFGYGADDMIFYNGPSINSPQISNLNGFNGSQGGGGVCYTVRADSCLTIQFISDGSTNFEGFEANWECFINPCVDEPGLDITQGATYEEIEAAISTPLAQITVDTVICADLSYGAFNMAEDTDLGLTNGLVLSSGEVLDIGQSNDQFASGGSTTSGDADLDALSILFGDGSTSNDACIVEVDVIVYATQLNFEYIFGSEEYPEFVDQFNDIFALLISGPGITGIPELNGQDNMAVIPDTDNPITINTVNQEDNWQYYKNNSNGKSVVFDGLTSGFLGNKKSLTASAEVQPCSTYHLKFAVADRGDFGFDSGVFISEIKSGAPEFSTKFSSGLDYFVENCLDNAVDTILLTIDEALDEAVTYTVVIGGTATEPDDFELQVGETITFEAGQTTFSIPVIVFDDEIDEGDETIIISITRNFGCGDVEITRIEVPIRENILVEIDTEQDSIIVCDGTFAMLEATGATSYTWSPFNVLDNPFVSNPTVDAGFEGWIYVEGRIDPFTSPECVGMDSIYIDIVDPMVQIVTDDPTQLCEGDTITLTAVNNINDNNVTWNVVNQFTNVESPNSPTTDYIPPFGIVDFDFQIAVSVELSGCIARDTLVVNVDPYTVLQPLFEDTIVCRNTELQLNQFDFVFDGTVFDISPTDFLDDPTSPFTTSTPLDDVEYVIISSSASGACMDTFTYNIEVEPNDVEIVQGDEIRICKGESLNLTAIFAPADAVVTWTPNDSLEVISDGEVIVNPIITTEYFVNASNSICSIDDSIRVFVDSLPTDMSITAIPVRDPYCQGEVVSFVSPGYQGFKFPNIEHLWEPEPNLNESEDTDYNIFVGADENRPIYIRTTVNGACMVMDTFEMNVINPAIELNIEDTTICSGESLDYVVMAEEGEMENIEWNTGSGTFTCDDCPETTLEDITSTTTVSVSVDVDGCPVSASSNVNVISNNPIINVEPIEIFCGGSTQLTFEEDGVVNSINWSTNTGTLSCTACANPELTGITDNGTVTLDLVVDDCPVSVNRDINIIEYGGSLEVNQDGPCNFYGDTVVLFANLVPVPNQEFTLEWFEGGELLPEFTNQNPITIAVPGRNSENDNSTQKSNVTYSYRISTLPGCETTIDGLVCFQNRFAVPTAFSPGNNDGRNDAFRLVDYKEGLTGPEILQFVIYNRWGQKMFDCEDFTCATKTGWNGKFNDKDQPSGTYMFNVEIRYGDGSIAKWNGDLLLMR